MAIKKAQAGTKVVKKPAVKIIKKTTIEAKNIKDATQMKKMRPTGPSSGRVKPTMGSAKNGKSFPDLNKDGKITKADILKGRGVIAQNGMSKRGNLKGYNPKTSPLDNTVNKGGYEKKMDTIGKGSTRSARLIDGKGNVLGQERLGSLGAKKMSEGYKKEKTDTESRRKTNLDFLESRKKTGQAATKSMKKAKSGTSMKKGMHKMPDGSMMKNSTMKSGGGMKKCKYGCK